MKITSVRATPLNVPLTYERGAIRRETSLSACYVEVETDQGLIGHGLTAITEEELVNAYRLNTVSAYRMSMACLPHLLKAENPSITNSGSFASAVPAYDILAYSTAKAALNQMMISIAHMLAHKVRVNTILIGTVMTEGYGDAGLDAATQERLKHPDNLIGRTGQPRDIANAMLWLTSPAAAWVSGQIIKVHGGGSVVRLFGQ